MQEHARRLHRELVGIVGRYQEAAVITMDPGTLEIPIMDSEPPEKRTRKSERIDGRGETILRLRAVNTCRVLVHHQGPDLSNRDHVREMYFGPGEEFDIPFSQALVLLARGSAKIIHDPE